MTIKQFVFIVVYVFTSGRTTDIPEIVHPKYWFTCAYLERTFGTGFIAQHSNYHIPEDEFLSGMRFGFAIIFFGVIYDICNLVP